MAELLNIATGKPEDLGEGEYAPALAAGTHVPTGGARAIVSPDGQLGTVAAADLPSMLQAGYSIPTQEQLDHFGKTAKFGGAADTATAAGLGFLRGKLPGVADAFISGRMASSPEAIAEYQAAHPSTSVGPGGEAEQTAAALKEVNPWAAGLGEVAGILTPGGAPKGISVLGHAIESGIAREGAGAARQIAAKALGMGAEGAAYGAANALTEASLGDPGMTAERVAAHIGLGAILGGALGGTIKAGSIATPKVYGAAKDTLQSGWRKLFGTAEGAKPAEPFFTPEGATKATEGAAEIPTGAPEIPSGQSEFTGAAENATGSPEYLEARKQFLPPEGAAAEAAPSAAEQLTAEPGIIPNLLGKAKEFAARGEAGGKVLTDAEYAAAKRDLGSTLQEAHDAVEKAGARAGSTVRPQESAELLAAADPHTAWLELGKVRKQFEAITAEMENNPALYPGRFPAKLKVIADDMVNIPTDAGAADVYKAITEARQAIDSKIPWGKEITGEAADAVALTKQLRSGLRTSLENEGVWGEAAARTAEFNESTNARLAALKEFRSQFMRKVPNRSGGVSWKVNPRKVSEFMNQINEPRGEMRADALKEFYQTSLDHIEQIDKTHANAPFETFDKDGLKSLIEKSVGQATDAQSAVAAQPGMGFGGLLNVGRVLMGNPAGLAKAAMGAVKGGLDAIPAQVANIEAASAAASKAIEAVGGAFVTGAESAPARRLLAKGAAHLGSEAIVGRAKDRIDEVRAATQNPEALVNHLAGVTAPGQAAAPKTMAALQQTAARGLAFLASKAPVHEADGPFTKAPPISTLEAQKFDRYYSAVHDPMAALHELAAGHPNPEALEALGAVYPKLLNDARQSVFAAIANHKDRTEVPYAKRMAISRFLGQPLDPSLNPQSMRRVQSINQGAGAAHAAQHAGPKPTQGGMGKLSLGQRSGSMFSQPSEKGA